MEAKSRTGIIVAVCVNPNKGTRKSSCFAASVGQFGLLGDYHNRRERRSFSQPGTWKPNTDRHISILAAEAYDALNAELGTALMPGDFGENILVRGVGDLSDVADGSLISIGANIVFRVVKQNKPCVNLQVYHHLMAKKAYGRRGLLCAIEKGHGFNILNEQEIIFDALHYQEQS